MGHNWRDAGPPGRKSPPGLELIYYDQQIIKMLKPDWELGRD